jgi:hypothetical protein
MIYLVVVPCLLLVHLYARRAQLPTTLFIAVFVGFWGLLYGTQLVIPGAEALVALCLSLACLRSIESYLDYDDGDEDSIEPAESWVAERHFCSRLTHDFAVQPRDSMFAIQLINRREWGELLERIGEMSAAQRQAFYVNLNYSSISERAMTEMVEHLDDRADTHVLMGHVQLCKAKRLGLKTGKRADENCTQAIASAFKSFKRALEVAPQDAEAHCGNLIAKVYIDLERKYIIESLLDTLRADVHHFHVVLAAARHLITDGESANTFIETVADALGDRDADGTTLAFARLVAHVECQLIYAPYGVAADTGVSADLADLYAPLEASSERIGGWASQISANLYACALQQTGQSKMAASVLAGMQGLASPYPWQLLADQATSGRGGPGKPQTGQLMA